MFIKSVCFSYTYSPQITATQTRAEAYQIYDSPRQKAQVLNAQN
jgi:hypothetical protein